MLDKANIKVMGMAFGFLLLGACATIDTPATAEKTTSASSAKAAETQSAKDLSDTLTSTKTTAVSDDGKLICKRTSVVGSNFKRKVCATAEEWNARASEDRKTTEGIQRSAGPGVTN